MNGKMVREYNKRVKEYNQGKNCIKDKEKSVVLSSITHITENKTVIK